MSQEPRDQVLDHEYDGIREYDNPTPRWWELIFGVTILFSVLYFVFLELAVAWSPSDVTDLAQKQYQDSVSAALRAQFSEIGELAADQDTILHYMHDSKWLQVGKSVYATHCQSCHGLSGEGLAGGGVNLTDDFFKNAKGITDLARIVSDGAAGGAMPAWKNRLHPNEVVLVASYVATFRGKNMPGRAPEGDRIPPWPTSPEEGG